MSAPECPWVDGLTFPEILAQTARRSGEHDALVFPQFSCRRSYTEFQSEGQETARALMALGIKRADHIGLWATNRPQWVLSQFATAAMRSALVTTTPPYPCHH